MEGLTLKPELLRSLTEICAAFGVSESTVRDWAESGAPIVIDGRDTKRRYSAEMNHLQWWRLQKQEEAKEL